MTTSVDQMPGLAKIQARFVEMLDERCGLVAQHALAAWTLDTLEEINGNLASAQEILHQIAGSAGSIGFSELGEAARTCEEDVVAHLEGKDADLAICPGEIMCSFDEFVCKCNEVLEQYAA